MDKKIMTEQKIINFHNINTVAINYKGVQIIKNSLNGGWMLFFSKTGKYPNQSPLVGTLVEMKEIIDNAIKIGEDGEKQLLQADTY
jgi:hypothetical protein